MAVILEDEPAAAADVEQFKVPSPPPALPALVEALQPPALLPPPHDDRSFASLDGLDAWRSSFERTVDRLAELLEADVTGLEPAAGEALAAALSRWVPAEAAEEQEGWVLEQRVRANVSQLLDKLPPPALLSLKPLFQSSPPPQLSTTSFRALPRPVHTDDVVPELEPWRATAGWGCWNVLRRAIEGLDAAAPVPIPVLLPPLLTLLDSTHAPTRLRGLHVLQAVVDKTEAAATAGGTSRGWGGERGKWLKQTGLGEVLVKSLNTLLLLPNSADAPLPTLHSTSLRTHLALSRLLYPRNSAERTAALDALIDKGLVAVYTYRQGGELGPDAREIAHWLAEADANGDGGLWAALGSIGSVRHLGALLPALLAPLSELALTSATSRTFGTDVLCAVAGLLEVAGEEGAVRVALWRGRVLDGLGRVWVGVKEAEVLPAVDQAGKAEFAQLEALIGRVLQALHRCSPDIVADLEDLVALDRRMFEGLRALV